MPNYTHVQFISWEIYTGPNKGPFPWDMAARGQSYTGLGGLGDKRIDINGQMEDIEARVAFTSNAMDAAHRLADPTETTLKVFMAPEFLYRGAGGAYLHDLINGWQSTPPADLAAAGLPTPYAGLFGSLQQFAGHANYDNWLFVFGTAISASFPVRKVDGKWVMDLTQNAEIYNTALIQRGGLGNTSDNYASRKHYISGIDFIDWWLAAGIHASGNVVPADPAALAPVEGEIEGSATFTINGINDNAGVPFPLGLEVCLDHASSGGDGANPWGRIRTDNRWVKLQLVPSGGMSLVPASIRLLPSAGPTPYSYAFNCDGLTTKPAYNWGSHTQIWNGANGADPVPPANQLITASTGGVVANTQVAPVIGTVMTANGIAINDNQLWDLGSGHVRVMQPMQL